MDRLVNKVAIITGSATGMGAQEAILFAKEGAQVVVCDIDAVKGNITTKTISAAGGESIFLQHDVTNESSWQKVVNETYKIFGKIDILVNNAGVLLAKTLENTTVEEWDYVFNVNCKGVFLGCKYVLPMMRKVGRGSIINISSIYGLVGVKGMAALAASKGAVKLLTKALAAECAPDIRVNSIHPGLIDTPLTSNIMADPQLYKIVLSETLLARAGKAEEVAQAALFLASDESSYMTGTELVVDGGYTAV